MERKNVKSKIVPLLITNKINFEFENRLISFQDMTGKLLERGKLQEKLVPTCEWIDRRKWEKENVKVINNIC